MSEEIEKLSAIRTALVAERRELSAHIAGAIDIATGQQMDALAKIQSRIELVDRIFEDEKKLVPSFYGNEGIRVL